MFIKRNRRRSGDDQCTSVLLVHGERVAEKRPRGRPRKDAPAPKTRVVHRVIANLSKLPDDLIRVIEEHCRGGRPHADSQSVCIGPCFGQLGALYALADELGIVRALGSSRLGRLALFLVLARVAHRGSRLSAARWSEDHAIAHVLGLGSLDEDDLYAALDWLDREQERIEVQLAGRRERGAVFLYDVTSSYLEGQQNELAAPGYNRDGKRFKKQVVVGLLTDVQGDPIAVRVYAGNTSDPATVIDPVRFVSDKLEATDVVFVGDRGMLKSHQRAHLNELGFRYLTALTDSQIRGLLRKQVIDMSLFDSTVAEAPGANGTRLLLRVNEDTRVRARQRRADQLKKIERKVEARNARVAQSARARADVSLSNALDGLAAYRLDRFVTARLEDRRVVLEIDQAKKTEVELLDGCYVLETDVPKEALDKDAAHARYMDLTKVERDFRTMKSGLLEIRPIFLRKAQRTRAHAFVTMLALKLTRALESRVQELGLTAQDALDRLAGVRLVTLAAPELGLWHLPTRFNAPQREILDRLPSLPPPLLSRPPTLTNTDS